MRLFIALAMGISIPLAGAGSGSNVARADAVPGLLSGAGADAASRGTTAGIALIDRRTGQYVDNGADAHLRFGSASLVKLFIADHVLHEVGLGHATLTAAGRNSLSTMLRSSDDAAASSFWSRFGANGIVSDVTRRYALTETTPPANPRYWGLTQVTAHDLAAFYDRLLSDRGGLAPADRAWIVEQLRASTPRGADGVYQWFGLHDGLPREPVLGVKQGWMCCFSDGYIWRHSTGIVGPDARYVVVVLNRDPGSLGSAHTVTSATRVVQALFPAGLVPRVNGQIADLWYGIGGHTSVLGLPTTDEIPLARGAGNQFERGRIYWSPGTGAHFVIGDILRAWGARGYERGILGYPTTDEIPLAGGAGSRFQGGSIYWSPSTGAHWLTGKILAAWGAQGYEAGPLGYPTTDPHTVAEGTRVDFQHGSLTLRSDGAVVQGSGTVGIAAPAPATAARTPATPSTSPATPSPAVGSTPSPMPTTTAPTAAPSGTPATSAPESTPTDGTP